MPQLGAGVVTGDAAVLVAEQSLPVFLCYACRPKVIPPLLALTKNRGQAARANFCLGVIPPRAIFGRS